MKALTGKKILSLLLSVLMCLSLMPLSAFADGETTSNVAKIGNVEYNTLEEAIAEAADGDTVTLLDDFEGNGIMIEKDRFAKLGLTIDFAGYTYTVNSLVGSPSTLTQAAHFEQGNKITLKDGTLCVSADVSAKAKILVQNYADLTVDGMALDGTNVQMSYQRLFTLSSNNGTVIINNSKITAPKSTFGNAVDICGFSSYNGTNVTVSGGSTISGTVCISADAAEGYDLSLNLESGSIVGKFFMGENAGIAEIKKSADFAISGATPSGYKWEDNADGSSSLKKLDCEAYIGGTYYMTLEEAIAAAKKSATIKLLKDITRSEKLVIDKALTINLDGHTFTSTYAINGGDRYAMVTNENVTIRNGSFVAENARAVCANANLTVSGATIKSGVTGGHAVLGLSGEGCTYNITNSTIKGDYAVCGFAKNITVKITGSTLEGTGNVLYHNGSHPGLNLTVKNSTINVVEGTGNNDACGVYISGTDTAYTTVGAQKATFTKCTINGIRIGVEVKYTDLTLDNCNVSVTETNANYSQNNNGPTTAGFAVVSTDNATSTATPAPKGSIVITGENGKYTGLVGLGSFAGVKETYGEFTDTTYAISGGTFSSAVLPEYCADGFIPAQNVDGTYGVKSGSYVAEVNGAKYVSLAEAVAAAKDGETVKLVSNTDMSNSGAITVEANITLDLNGKTLKMSNTNKGSILIKNATFTLKDGTDTAKNGTGTGKIYTETVYSSSATGNCLITADDNGHFVMESGLIDAASFTSKNADEGQFAVGVFNTTKNTTASLTVNGGHIKAGWYALAGNGGANNGTGNITVNGGIIESVADYAIYHPQNGTTTINGGTVYGAAGGISLNRGKLIVNGGTITSKGTGSTGNWGDGTGGQDAAAINVNAGYGDADAQITGGKITAEKDAILLGTGANYKATIAVSGGTFSSEVPADYCSDGYKAVKNSDGMYGIIKKLSMTRNMILENTLTMTYNVNPGEYTIVKGVYSFYDATLNNNAGGYVDTVVLPVLKSEGIYALNFNGINSQRMLDGLKLTIFLAKDNDVIEYALEETTIKDYLVWILKSDEHSNYHELASNLLEYGAADQKLMNYRKDELVTDVVRAEGVTLTSKSYVNKLENVESCSKLTKKDGGITINGRQLVLYNSVHIKLAFVLEEGTALENVSFEVKVMQGGSAASTTQFNSADFKLENGKYYLDFSNIMASELDNEIVFTSYVNGEENDSYTCTVNDYLRSIYTNDTNADYAKFKDIALALFNCGYSCDNLKK